MNVIVLASACRTSGALTIYKQFLRHLPDYVIGNKYYIFVDPQMEQPEIDNVTYIHVTDHSYKHRIYMDRRGYMDEIRKRDVFPNVVFSLQNTGCITSCAQVIYYHQSIPFYKRSWNLLNKSERTMFLYKYIYPFFVKQTLNKNTDIVVQIPFIKKGFVKRFNYNPDKVHVAFPDVEDIDIDCIAASDFDKGHYNFIYPATNAPYKGHLTIAKALRCIQKKDSTLLKNIRIHVTITQQDNNTLNKYISDNNLADYFVFHGCVPHKELLSYLKGACGLLFPSTIETLGLPLLEAASFGLPILAADLDYAHEVVGDYDGIRFVSPTNYDIWAEKILDICKESRKYTHLKLTVSQWPLVFKIILNH